MDKRDSLQGCTPSPPLNYLTTLKCVEKLLKYLRENYFLVGPDTYIYKSCDLSSEEESLKANFVAFGECLGFMEGVVPYDN